MVSLSTDILQTIDLGKNSELNKHICIGSGAFSDVFLVKHIQTGELFALKEIPKSISNSNLDEEIIDETVKQNIKVTIDLLFKANNILSDIVLNLNESLKDKFDYESFDIKEQELIKEAFLLAKFIQKVCMSDDLAEDVVVKFNNIISNIEESV